MTRLSLTLAMASSLSYGQVINDIRMTQHTSVGGTTTRIMTAPTSGDGGFFVYDRFTDPLIPRPRFFLFGDGIVLEPGPTHNTVSVGVSQAIEDWANDEFLTAAEGQALSDAIALKQDASVAFSGAWGDLTGKPSTFAPSSHSHAISDVTGLSSALTSKLDASAFTWANLSGKPIIPPAITLTTTGTGAATFNGTTGALNVPTPTPYTLPNTGTAGTYGLVTTDAQGRVIAGKRTEAYSGTTNASGMYTVTFTTSYATTPNIQANIIGATDTQDLRIISVSSTGFTVRARNLNGLIGLLPSYSDVSGASVDVLITEK